jgi:hypothetical protein
MTREAQEMIDHIAQLIPKPSVIVHENTPLVSSGLIDSMMLIDLLVKLKDLDTIAKMFATAQRVGKPRK